MKRYEAYMQTGTTWIPSIPASWKIKKVSELFSQRKEKVSDKEFTPISVTKNGILPQLENAAKTDDGDNRKKVCVGDFVINSRSDRKGSCGVSPLEGSVSLINIVLQPRSELEGRYAHYLLRSQPFSEEYYRNGRGIVADLWTTRYSEMKTILLPIPPRAEQDQIVRYLDWQVAKINRLIAAKKIQLELLEDVLLTTIQQSISLAPERDIDCLLHTVHSWIPGGWSCPLLGQLLDNIEQGWSPNAGEELNDPDQWHVLTLSAIKHGTYYPEANKPIDIHESVPEKLEVHRGDILMTRSNTRALVGDVCLVESSVKKLIFSDLVYRLNVRKQLVYPRYLMYYLLSSFARLQIERLAKGSSGTMPKLSHADIRKLRVILPSLEEQKLISDKLDKAVRNIQQASMAILKQIECILEYRTRLIPDVVTGQADVRGIEVPDYESVEQIEILEDEDRQEDNVDEC